MDEDDEAAALAFQQEGEQRRREEEQAALRADPDFERWLAAIEAANEQERTYGFSEDHGKRLRW